MVGAAQVRALTRVVALEELSDGTGSGSVAETVAVLVMVPVAVALAVMETVALAPLLSVPRAQVTVVVPLHEPCVVVAETYVVPAGNVSLTTTFVAAIGPLFVTVME